MTVAEIIIIPFIVSNALLCQESAIFTKTLTTQQILTEGKTLTTVL